MGSQRTTLRKVAIGAPRPPGHWLPVPTTQVNTRKEIINLVRSNHETLLPSFGEWKGSSKSLVLVGKRGSGYGGKSGKAHGDQERSRKGNEGNGNARLKYIMPRKQGAAHARRGAEATYRRYSNAG